VILCGFGGERPAALGASALGLGDAAVATGAGTTALYSNPAGMAHIRQHTFDLGFLREPTRTSLYTSSVDNTSEWGLAAGVGYSYDSDWTQDIGTRRGHDVRGGSAFGFVSEAGRLLFGASVGYLDVALPGRDVAGWSGDLGVAVGVSALRLGAVVRNAWRADKAVTPRRIAAGVGLVTGTFLAEADGSWGMDAHSGAAYRVGGAVQFGEEGVQLRAGYRYVDGDHGVTGGVSWRTTQFSLDTGLAVDDPGGVTAVSGSIGLTFVVPYDVVP